ncbi:unnamed protein product [Brugia timori]|uniref:Uncharacterized protein n=1 Tax=Brugia timori TaxID=42155 RepID=A0A0R3QVX2_9BILA|nr:unnamed protein product [Brugia timori]
MKILPNGDHLVFPTISTSSSRVRLLLLCLIYTLIVFIIKAFI